MGTASSVEEQKPRHVVLQGKDMTDKSVSFGKVVNEGPKPSTEDAKADNQPETAGGTEHVSGKVAPPEVSTTKYDEFCTEKFARLRQTSSIWDAETFSFSDIERLKQVLAELIYTYQLYFEAQNHFSRLEYERFQRALCEVLLETNHLKLYEKILDEVPKTEDFCDANHNQIITLTIVMGSLHNFTDLCDPFAVATTKSTIVKNVKVILEVNSTKYLANQCKDTTYQIIVNCHGIMHNTSMRESNIPALRNLNLIPTLQPYLESAAEMTRISTLATLANIVTEEECDVIKTHKLVVAQLLHVLQHGCDDVSRRCNGWSCKECVLAVWQLARNDANKKLLVELNTIPVLVKVAQTGDDEEKKECIHAILQISFEEEARKQIANDPELSALHLLVEMKDSADKDIADLSVKALWNLREELKNSKNESFRKIAKELFPSSRTDVSIDQHIMISYQSANREFLVKIKDRVKTKGYKVWMDVEQMSGDILETMAQGVENAAIVLICFSRKYKESDFCRQEAQYAHKLKKPIIPLKMEEGYEPDGWLGFMLASEYFVNLSGKYLVPPKTEEKIQDLFRQIEKKWKTGMDFVDTAIVVKTAPVVAKSHEDTYAGHGAMPSRTVSEEKTPRRSKFANIRQWTNGDVTDWLRRNNLENCGFEKITGVEISLLARMLMEAPDQLYKCLRQDLKIKTLVAKANFVWALEDLIETECG